MLGLDGVSGSSTVLFASGICEICERWGVRGPSDDKRTLSSRARALSPPTQRSKRDAEDFSSSFPSKGLLG